MVALDSCFIKICKIWRQFLKNFSNKDQISISCYMFYFEIEEPKCEK